MNADDSSVLLQTVLQDAHLCQHLREAPNEAEFWGRLETLSHELGLRPDFDALKGMASGAFTFWLTHWSNGGMA